MKSQTEQEALRNSAAARIRDVLGSAFDIEAIAQEPSRITAPAEPHSALAWAAPGAARGDTLAALLRIARPVIRETEPQLVLRTDGPESEVYMRRWWLAREADAAGHGRNGLYLHVFEADDPAAPHDHPWASASLLLEGWLVEHSPQGVVPIEPGTLSVRPARFRHRLVLGRDSGGAAVRAMSLFATGTRVRSWGFETPDGRIAKAGTAEAGRPARAR